ncbi:MAG: bifunctional phosphopantothenoylcysteine decarboxylase/phosphopantothenate--cysteine ligase CoaBC, partial [bacterium]|nr:bifunctional phosphopantothenoylcysteine decarboxylase/phosphopantothenate--cysteine ligase CoaBC [bacterium]
VVAPATANLLAKMAHGLADDAATTLLLAWEGPMWIAPAMNTAMWRHPATQRNMAELRARGVRVFEPEAGRLACGEVGEGRMAAPEAIVGALAEALAGCGANGALHGKTVLVTAGPTREALDPIRFISNRSTGRMGAELAAEALARGGRVLFVHGPLTVPLPEGVEPIAAESAREMLAAVQSRWDEVDLAIFAAAVANYESAAPADTKIKGGDDLTLKLRRTPDIAGWAGAHRRSGQVLVGFAAESVDLLAVAQRKLAEKRLDLICANPIGEAGIGFEAGENRVLLVAAAGEPVESPRAAKRQVAAWIWDRIEALIGNRA